MKLVKIFKNPVLLVIASVMISACVPQERLQTVSDSCLLFKRGTAELDGARINEGEQSWEDLEEGNQYDTDETFFWILEHNEVYDRVCGNDDRN